MNNEEAQKVALDLRERVLELISDLEEYTDFLKRSMTSNRPEATLPYEWAESVRNVALQINDHMTRLCAIDGITGGLA